MKFSTKIMNLFLCGLVLWQSLYPSLSLASNSIFEEPNISFKGKSDTFSKWQHVEHIDGSGGGVHVYQDPALQQQFTVKEAVQQNHLIEELTAKALYRVLEFNASPFIILDRTSQSWPAAWNQKFPEAPRLLISSFIEAGPANKDPKEKLLRWVDVLLGNFDLVSHNYIIDPHGEIWPIDFGGSLRFRASGTPKEHKDLWGYFWPKDDNILPPTTEELQKFKARLPKFFEKLIDLHREFSIPDFPSLWNILASRVHSFLKTYDPMAPEFYGDRPALEGQVAGGVLLITDINETPHALLAKRAGGWGDLGGAADFQDRTINRTAWREAIEEVGNFIPLDYSSLISCPYIESFGDVLYRMFLMKVPSIGITGLKKHVRSSNNPYRIEHDDYMLVPLESLASYQDLYPPMRSLLSTLHAQAMLKGFYEGQSLRMAKGGSCFTGYMSYGNHTFPILKLDLIPSRVFEAKAKAAIKLKSKLQMQPTIFTSSTTYPYTQTRGFMKAHLQKAYVEGQDAHNLKALLPQKSSFFKDNPDEVSQKLPLILNIIAPEDQYPNHCVYYHGGRGHFGILWVIASLLRNELFLTEDEAFKTLRLYENAFENTSSLSEHFGGIKQKPGFVDFDTGGQARILSTNLSLLGRLGDSPSETLSYFFGNKCVNTNEEPINILKQFLDVVLKLPPMSVDQFMSEVTPYFTSLDKVGVLYQLFLPMDLAHQYTYLSHEGGKKVLYQDQQNDETVINSPLDFVQILRKTPEIAPDKVDYDFNKVEGRIFLHPDMLYGDKSAAIHSNLYFADGRSVDKLRQTLKDAITRIIKPHLHFSLSHQAYTQPPRLIQLYNLITGAKKDETEPRLEALIKLAEEDDEDEDILQQLEDISVAKLAKVDPISIQRTRAFELSPLLEPLADSIAQKLTTFTQTEWADYLKQLKDKYERIVSFVKDNKLDDRFQSMTSLSPLLKVGSEDPEFTILKCIFQSDYIQNLLHQSDPEILRSLGKIGVQLHHWGEQRESILKRLEQAGFIILDGKSKNGFNVLNISKNVNPQQIQDALDMLIAEKFAFSRQNGITGCEGGVALLNQIIKTGIQESRQHLKQLVVDLDIKQPILYSTANDLSETKIQLGTRWNSVAKSYVRLLKPFNLDEQNWDEALLLLDEEGDVKIGNIIQLLKTQEFFRSKSRTTTYAFIDFLKSLCQTKSPSHTISQIKSLSLESQGFNDLCDMTKEHKLKLASKLHPVLSKLGLGSEIRLHLILSEFEKLSDTDQDKVVELLKQIPLQSGDQIEFVLRIWKNFPNRRQDIERLLPCILEESSIFYVEQAIKWALAQDSNLVPHICLFFQLGFSMDEGSTTYYKPAFAILANNYEKFKKCSSVIKSFISNYNSFTAYRDSIFNLIEKRNPSPEKLQIIIEIAKKYSHESYNETICRIINNYDVFEQYLEALIPILLDHNSCITNRHNMIFNLISENRPSLEALKVIIDSAFNAPDDQLFSLVMNHCNVIEKNLKILQPFLNNELALQNHGEVVFTMIDEKAPSTEMLESIIGVACKFSQTWESGMISLVIDNYDVINTNLEIFKPFLNNHVVLSNYGNILFDIVRQKSPSQEQLKTLTEIAAQYTGSDTQVDFLREAQKFLDSE